MLFSEARTIVENLTLPKTFLKEEEVVNAIKLWCDSMGEFLNTMEKDQTFRLKYNIKLLNDIMIKSKGLIHTDTTTNAYALPIQLTTRVTVALTDLNQFCGICSERLTDLLNSNIKTV